MDERRPSGPASVDAPRPSASSRASHPAAATQLAWIVTAAALVGASGEQALRVVASATVRPGTYFNPQGIWLFPLLGALLLAASCGIVAIFGSPRGRLQRVAFVAAAFALAETLLLVPRVAPWALVLLAIGVASRVARLAGAFPRQAVGIARLLTIVLGGASLLWGAGWNTYRAMRASQTIAALPPAPPGAPNVVLVVLDAVRAASTSVHGGTPGTTPFLERLASSCVRFDRAIATSSWTLPTHASLFTGHDPAVLGVDWKVPLDGRRRTLAEALASSGYATGGSVSNYLYTYREFGLDRGFAEYRDYGVSAGESALRSVPGDYLYAAWNRATHGYAKPGRKDAGRVTRDILPFIDAAGGRPFFAFLNLYDAHDPYAPPSPWDRRFTGGIEPRTRDVGDPRFPPDSATLAGLKGGYEGGIAYMDAELERFVRELQRRGAAERTMLIVTSDHGEEFAEHGYTQHGHSLHLPSLHVPLLVCNPGGEGAGTVVAEPVSLRDIPATIVDVLGVESSYALFPGRSLRSLWRPAAGSGGECHSAPVSRLTVERLDKRTGSVTTRALASIVDDSYQLIRGEAWGDELYDLRADPETRTNLAADPAHVAVRERLAETLRAGSRCTGGEGGNPL